MAVVSDGEWGALKVALDRVRCGKGRRFADKRRTIEAVVWRLRNGAPWRAVPAELGPWRRAAQLHRRWSRQGAWARLFEVLREQGHADLGEVFMDATNVRAAAWAAGATGGPA